MQRVNVPSNPNDKQSRLTTGYGYKTENGWKIRTHCHINNDNKAFDLYDESMITFFPIYYFITNPLF